jgi:hypothetical protein
MTFSRALLLLLLVGTVHGQTRPRVPLYPPVTRAISRGACEFTVDALGHVYWLNQFGNICRDEQSTTYKPAVTVPFQVDTLGRIVYVDGFGSLLRDGEKLNSAHPDQGRFAIDHANRVLWIDGSTHHVVRDGEDLGYLASPHGLLQGDSQGHVTYMGFSDQMLYMDKVSSGIKIDSVQHLLTEAQTVYYWTPSADSVMNLWEYDFTTGKTALRAAAAREPFLALDPDGRAWFIDSFGALMRQGKPKFGLLYYGPIRLDAAGNAYTRKGHTILRNGKPTGFDVLGSFDVSPAGDVFAVTNTTNGTIERNGRALSFNIR